MKKTLFIAVFLTPVFFANAAIIWTPDPIPDLDTPVYYTIPAGHWYGIYPVEGEAGYTLTGFCQWTGDVADGATIGDFETLGSMTDYMGYRATAIELVEFDSAPTAAECSSNAASLGDALSSSKYVGSWLIFGTISSESPTWFLPDLSGTAADLGAAVSSTTGSQWPLILIFMGVPFAFYVLGEILHMTREVDRKDKELYAHVDAVMRETEKLLRNKRGT